MLMAFKIISSLIAFNFCIEIPGHIKNKNIKELIKASLLVIFFISSVFIFKKI